MLFSSPYFYRSLALIGRCPSSSCVLPVRPTDWRLFQAVCGTHGYRSPSCSDFGDRATAESCVDRFRFRVSALRNCVVRYPHTAHQLGRARICYRFHPFFDHEVEIIRTLRLREEPSVIARIHNDLRIAVPCWMLDQTKCDAAVLRDRPRFDVDALRRLRELVDLQSFISDDDHDSAQARYVKGDRHGPRTTDGTASSANA